MRNPRRVPLLSACALLLAAAGVQADEAHPQLAAWRALLHDRVRTVSAHGAPFDTRFDYEQFYVDEQIWTRQQSQTLTTVRAELLAVSPSRMSAKDRLAWAIDLYDFLVVERATMHLLVPRHAFQRYESVDQMNFAEGAFFDVPVVDIEGSSYTLAQFERRFVYDDSTAADQPRTKPADPRIAFALCHGTDGGAPLLPWAFSGDSLDAQLDRATRIALALPRFVRVDPATQTIELSDLFFQQRIDTGGSLDGVRPLLARLGPPDVRKAARNTRAAILPRTMLVDRKLNLFVRPRPAAPAATNADSLRKT